MRIGLMTEGRPDQAVIQNILTGILGELEYEAILIRPELLIDETDISLKNKAALGGLSRIKTDCKEKKLLESFFAIDFEDKDFLIVQLDTAEIEQFNIVRPNKKNNNNYSSELKENTIQKIREWLNDSNYDEKIIYAISIEEMEAWLLTIYEKRDSTNSINPKSKLQRILGKKNLTSVESYDNYLKLSKGFKKKKKLHKLCKYNESLLLFIQDVKDQIDKINP